MSALVMGMNHGMDTKDSITKKKSALMDYLIMHIRVRMNSSETTIHRTQSEFRQIRCLKNNIPLQ